MIKLIQKKKLKQKIYSDCWKQREWGIEKWGKEQEKFVKELNKTIVEEPVK